MTAAVLFALVLSFTMVVAFYSGPSRQTVLDLMNIVTPLVAAVVCFVAAKRVSTRRLAVFWLLVGMGLALSFVAESVWAVYEVFLGVDVPYPSVADLLWLLSYPLQFAAIIGLLAFRGKDRLATVASGLDALMFGLAAAALSWQFIALPALDAEAGWMANTVSVFYPAGDVLLLFGLLSLALIPRRSRLPKGMAWVATAFAVNIAADLIYTLLEASGSYATGSWVDPLWPLSYALVGAAALWQLSRLSKTGGAADAGPALVPDANDDKARRKSRRSDRLHMALPYLTLPVAGLLLLSSLLGGEASTIFYRISSAAAAFLVISLVVARQLVSMLDNRRLQTFLETEKEQLALLNEVALSMSHCGSSKQTICTGLQLVQQALRCDTAGMWLRLPGLRERFYGAKGLGRADRRELQLAARRALDSENPIMQRQPILLSVEDGTEAGSQTPAAFSTIAILPLISRQTCLGALCVGIPSEQLASVADRLDLAAAVASQVAVAFENVRRFEDAQYLAERDSVTGLMNHRGVNARIEQELARCRRAGGHFTLVMMDLDDFKLFNDTYGHAVGDEVLKSIARILGGATRRSDVLARYGGDEFLALLPDTDAAQALVLVQRVQAAVSSYAFMPDLESKVPILVSYGVATYPDEGRQASEVLSVADANLYRSKTQGGNRITAPSPSHPSRREDHMGAFGVLEGLVTTVDNKDHYTRKHSEDVCRYSASLAAGIGLSAETQRALRIASLLHDVGKIGVPDHILRKPAGLTKDEYEAAQQHVKLGELIIKEIPNLGEVLHAVATHHERFDGSGYPRGVKGEAIPLLGRILAVTDAYSAMTTDRPYRKAFSQAEAREELRRVAGTQLDPHLVDAFIRLTEGEMDQSLPTASSTVA